jgi:hypothetical protein
MGVGMNERIRKIAIEADAWCDKYYFGDKFYDIEWEKKFAELIVRECAHLVDTLNEAYGAPSTAGKFIKQQFGVKE